MQSDAGLYYPKNIMLLGTSYRKLALEQRELLAVIERNEKELLEQLQKAVSAEELALISTCNRFEVIAVNPAGSPQESQKTKILKLLENKLGRPLNDDDFYCFDNRGAVRHFFSVAASLDSMVLGEAQILGQVKDAYRRSVDRGLAGKFLHHLFQFSFHLAKKIRTNTGIAERGVSVSYVAVKLAEQIFGSLKGRAVLIIGSGQMAELAALHLKTHGASEIIVANRTLEKAIELANKIEGSAISLSEIANYLARADVIIASLSQVDKPLITESDLKRARRAKDLFLLDLGVPRNLSPALSDIDDVYLYNIDDLSKIADSHRLLRAQAAKDAEVLIEYGLVQFEKWLSKVSLEPAIIRLRARVHEICRGECEKILAGRIYENERAALSAELARRIANKISHELLQELPESEAQGESLAAELFYKEIHKIVR